MGQIIAIVSGKGGTGKTSLCAGIAASLADSGKRVLCIDADVGLRNLDLSLGMPDLASIPFTDLIRSAYSPEQIPSHTELKSLFLLTAPVTEEPEDISEELFRSFLSGIRSSYDFCLIDAPAGIGTMFRLVTGAADRVLVVANCDPASLRDASSVAQLLGNRPAGCVKLIVNRVVPRMLSRMKLTLDDVMDMVGLPLMGIVPEDVNVPLAAVQNTPLILFTGRRAAKACKNIAVRLTGIYRPLMRIR